MRWMIDFYKENPRVLVMAVILGLIASVTVGFINKGGIIAPVILLAILGIALGLAISASRNRGDGS